MFGSSSESEERALPDGCVRVLRSRTRVKKDVNFIPEDENMSVYESFSSGESDGEVLAEEDEDDVCRDRGDRGDANDVLSDSDAVQMDETFVASLQVGKGALDKRAMKQREDALRAMEWNPVSSAYEEGNCLLPQI
ncbi:hypothetical protein Pcac1_g6847 [Phytophthora cactorum]|nr:hypothetical protein Pcac1_g6847 [Phytophthora cactorum]